MVDGYELLGDLDEWFRDQFLPGPSGRLRHRARRARRRPTWCGGTMRVAGADSRCTSCGCSTTRTAGSCSNGSAFPSQGGADLARIGRGHPLALALLAEASADVPSISGLADAPAVVAALCARIVDDVPDEAHRTGLATCAHATRMTQDLLDRTVGRRAPEVWTWLESRPYVRRGEIGLFLHDVVREVFEAELAQRSPDAYAALHIAVRGYFLDRLVDPAEARPERAAAEILLLHRAGPLADRATALRDAGLLSIVPARAGGPRGHRRPGG